MIAQNDTGILSEKYWMKQLSGTLPAMDLVAGLPAEKENVLYTYSVPVPAALVKAVADLTGNKPLGRYTFFLAVLNLLAYKYTRSADILICTGTFRADENADENILFLRQQFAKHTPVKQLLEQCRNNVREAIQHQDFPYRALLQQLTLNNRLYTHSLFRIALTDQSIQHTAVVTEECELCVNIENTADNNAYQLTFSGRNAGLAAYMPGMAAGLLRIAASVLENPGRQAAAVTVLTADESRQIIYAFNDNAREGDAAAITTLFDETAANFPDRTAITAGSRYTYGDLHMRANSLAGLLLNQYVVEPGNVVGLRLQSSPELIVAILAILKCRAAVLLIDSAIPAGRMQYMLQNSGARLLLTATGSSVQTGVDIQQMEVPLWEELQYANTRLPEAACSDIAFIQYTSGSTGLPKAAAVTHANLWHHFRWFGAYMDFRPEDVLAQKTAFSFTDCHLELLFPLTFGKSAVCLRPYDAINKDNAAMHAWLQEAGVTILQFVPSVFEQFIRQTDITALQALRCVILSGEALKHTYDLPVRMYNLYGCTECTATTSIYPLDGDNGGKVPIGRPVYNVTVYILDEDMLPVPVGARGYIYVGGKLVTEGYIFDEAQQAQKFLPSPFAAGERLYCTGDTGSYMPDGTMLYWGRKDQQVKIRGIRIEPEEIVAALKNITGIEQVEILAGDAVKEQLIAIYTGQEYSERTLKQKLQETLPEYMVPARLVYFPEMLLNANGKADRNAMLAKLREADQQSRMAPPANAAEESLLQLWYTILETKEVGVNSNFFAAGGHSLNATRLLLMIQDSMQVKLNLQDIFNYPTVRELAGFISGKHPQQEDSIPVAPAAASYPLSGAQQRLWLLQQNERSDAAYRVGWGFRIKGSLQIPALEKAFNSLIERHEILRTRFLMPGGVAVQEIIPVAQVDFHITVNDISAAADKEAVAAGLAAAAADQPFELSEGRLLRVTLLRFSDAEHLLLLTLNHLVCDGWSMNILLKEVMENYTAFVNNSTPSRPALRIQYRDYAVWQQQQLQTAAVQAQRKFWLNEFSGEVPVLELPADKVRPAVKSYAGDVVRFSLDSDTKEALLQLGHTCGASLFMTLMAVVKTLLYRYTGQPDIIIGTPESGRSHKDLENQVGYYANTLALRTNINAAGSFLDLLEQVKTHTLEAYRHADHPFEKLVEELSLQRDASRSPLFDVMLVLQHVNTLPANGLPGLTIDSYDPDWKISRYDLLFRFTETADGIDAEIEYNTDIFTTERISRMQRHYVQLLQSVIAAPEQTLSSIVFMDDAECKLIQRLDRTHSYYPWQDIAGCFEQQAAAAPHALAVVYGNRQLTYQDLNESANKLAHYLKKKGVDKETLVPVCLERSPELIIAILAILKAGGAYVPIDAGYTHDRAAFIIRDTAAALLITTAAQQLPLEDNVEYVLLDEHAAAIAEMPAVNPAIPVAPQQLAYVMYTSGSTGYPKGVMVEHRSVISLVKNVSYVRLNAESVLLASGSPAFDAATFEYWGMLLNGGQLVLCSDDTLLNVKQLTQEIKMHHVNIMWFTVGWFNQLVDINPGIFEGLQQVLAGGDKLSPRHINLLKQRYPALEVINGYGPTENTTFSLTYHINTADAAGVPIGIPLEHRSAFVLDGNGQVCAPGITGEIYVGGSGLARGYFRREELTAERFVEMQGPLLPAGRYYRTGDLGCLLPDGNIAFAGRNDGQVKIRGFRVEPGEVENALLRQPEIAQCVVITTGSESNRQLVAYLVAAAGGQLSQTGLQRRMKQVLPAYMVPAAFVWMEVLPVNSNGKVDRQQLPAPEIAGMGMEAPDGILETQLLHIWKEVLNITAIGVTDNFFEAGGHSLKAMRVVSRIAEVFGVSVEQSALFRYPTVRELAAVIAAAAPQAYEGIAAVGPEDDYPLSHAQKRLWLLEQSGQAGSAYCTGAGYRFRGILDAAALEQAFVMLIERHEILRTLFDTIAGEPRQQVKDITAINFRITFTDISGQTGKEQLAEEIGAAVINTPFDLKQCPLLRARLVKMDADTHLFFFGMHHIICDEWSMQVMIKELLHNYASLVAGTPYAYTPLRIQYKDYTLWQQQQLQNEWEQDHRRYWLKRFAGELPVLDLATDFTRPAVNRYQGRTLQFNLGLHNSRELEQLGRRHGASLFMTLLAALHTLLYRYTGQEDIVIGSPEAGRNHKDLEDQIGYYVNTLALRNQVNGKDGFSAFLESIRKSTLEAYQHAMYPFDLLVDQLLLQRDQSRAPLFDVMMVLAHAQHENEIPVMEGITASLYEIAMQGSKYDLLFRFTETAEGIHAEIEYNTDLFREERIQRMARHFEALIAAVLQQPEQPLAMTGYLDANEKEQLINVFNPAPVPYPVTETLATAFEKQAASTPGNIAATFDGVSFTYKQLNEQSNRLAHYLVNSCGIGRHAKVGILQQRSVNMLVSILGVLKAGACYVPLNEEHPAGRIHYCLDNIAASLVILDNREAIGTYNLEGYNSISWDQLQENDLAAQPVTDLPQASRPEDTAYVIFTSGTTGQPKSVLVAHNSVINLILAGRNYFEFNTNDSWTLFHNINFDVTVWEIFGALLCGARVVSVPKATTRDQEAFIQLLLKENITVLAQVPSAFSTLLEVLKHREPLPFALRYVIFCGEALNPKMLEPWCRRYPAAIPINMYGITETTVHVTFKRITAAEVASGESNIGIPLPNMEVYIMDEYHQLKPVGAIGEIVVGGIGVAQGYHNSEALNALKFIPHPFKEGKRLYCSGDLGMMLPNGEVIYKGRKDLQIKIRGFRIEPGEIEAALLQHSAIDAALVISRKDKDGAAQLVAYIVSAAAPPLDELRAHLAGRLPEYMIPASFVALPEFPVTANGKIDRAALPAPGDQTLLNEQYAAPRNETETALVQIWQQVLDLPRVGITDNFFAIGGHSLRGTQLVFEIYKHMEVKIELKTIFTYPTINQLAPVIAKAAPRKYEPIPLAPAAAHYPLSHAQRRLWLLERMGQGSYAYNMPAVFRFTGTPDTAALEKALQALVNRHEVLRTIFTETGGEPRQVIAAPGSYHAGVTVMDVRNEPDPEAAAIHAAEQDASTPFDLKVAPLIRGALIRVSNTDCLFLLTMHHIVSDAWSVDILMKELTILYEAFRQGGTPALPPLRMQYKDYAVWQHQALGKEKMAAHRNFWLNTFSGEIPVLEMPLQHARPLIKTYNGKTVHEKLDQQLALALSSLGQKEGASLFMTLLSVVYVLLHRYSGQEDLVLGTPVAGRDHPDLDNQSGFYVNMLALRNKMNGGQSFTTILRQVRDLTLQAYEHQVYPFDLLVEELAVKRDMSRHPLFDAVVVLQNSTPRWNTDTVKDMQINTYHVDTAISKYDLTFSFVETTDGIELTIEYNTDLFSGRFLQGLCRHAVQLAGILAAGPEKPVLEQDFLDAAEHEQLLQTFNNTHRPYPHDKTAATLFAAQAAIYPDHIAVSMGEISYTYKELNQAANKLAVHLRDTYGIGEGKYVGILMKPSPLLPVAMLGIMKTGAAYVPIEPDMPASRIHFILNDTQAALVLLEDEELTARHQLQQTACLLLSAAWLNELPASSPLPVPENSKVAYVIYTSGSTGQPKGVAVPHAGLVNLCCWHMRQFNVGNSSRATIYSSIGFDAAGWEIWPYLLAGACLYPLEQAIKLDMPALHSFFSRQHITHAFLPTAVYEQFCATADPALLKTLLILTGGDALRKYKGRVANNYGPSESTVVTTSIMLNGAQANAVIPIGKPIDNTQVYILNKAMLLQPVGVSGDIYISGSGLAMGYLNQPELTAQQFIPHPFEPSSILYRSGDTGRWLPDGTVEFTGRSDAQFKIRGIRIEAGEIENRLLALPGVQDARVCVLRTDDNTLLAAYLVCDEEPVHENLRGRLSAFLPPYMIPDCFVRVPSFKLTANGKLDTSVLPAVSAAMIRKSTYQPPAGGTEQLLAAIWKEVLGDHDISVYDNFFEIGGNSVKLIAMHNKLIRHFGDRVNIADLFIYNNIRTLGGLLQNMQETAVNTGIDV